MGADRVKVEHSAAGGEHKAQRKTMPALIETFPQGANAGPVDVLVSKRISNLLDQFPDFFPLRFGTSSQGSQQIGVEPNLQRLLRCLR